MELEKVAAVVQAFSDSVPDKVVTMLEDVEVVVCKDPAETKAKLVEEFADDATIGEGGPLVKDYVVPADCRGLFVGDPMETDDTDAEEVTSVMPDGIIFLVASNLQDETEAKVALLHEVGHALGMSEDEVSALGLGSGKEGEAESGEASEPS